MQVYQETKSEIITIMTELTIVPTLEFEKLVCEKDTTFRPTKENMTALRVCFFTNYLLIYAQCLIWELGGMSLTAF